MRVNSVFKGLCNNRLTVGSGISIMIFTFLFTTPSFAQRSNRDVLEKRTNLIIRQIGHRLLLQAGDSISRVLPVSEVKEGTFQLMFENELDFNHDSLMMLSRGLLPKTQFPSGYTVTVHDRMNADLVYGFQINNTSPDILACSGRRQPPGRYVIEFAFADFYGNVGKNLERPSVEQANAEHSKADRKKAEVDRMADELRPVKQLPEKPKSVNADPQEVNPKLEDLKTTTFDYPLINLVGSGMLVALGIALLIGHWGKSSIPAPGQRQDHTMIEESVQELPSLGKFLFDVPGQRLLLASEVIRLTDKECKILELLNESFGELITRETLMQKVWINEGVVTGRSLDMFVSKLRKKLSRDPELKITNVHGKGYKLEIPGIQIL